MKSIRPLSTEGRSLLACPRCTSDLEISDDRLFCKDVACGLTFRVTDNIPVLMIDDHGGRDSGDLACDVETAENRPGFLKRVVKAITPGRSLNFVPQQNYRRFFDILAREFESPRVLILGGAEIGNGLNMLEETPGLRVMETDVYVGSRTQLICDAQFLPFKDGSFDAVIIQAVLEYISDTDQCIDQIYRVLSDNGLVYSETPFMQQSQAFPDLKRFTLLGHNQAFYKFQELGSGPVAAQGTVLYWAWEFFLCGFSKGLRAQAILRRVARFTGFWLKYFDYLFIAKDTADDSASAYYFMGMKNTGKKSPENKMAYLKEI